MADFKAALTRTLGFEGWWSFLDQGTYAGIVRKMWPNWPGWVIIDAYCRKIGRQLHYNERVNDVPLDPLIAQFYRSNFWSPIKGDDITPQLIAELLFDFHVNAGEPAITRLQDILKVPSDGQFGPLTLKALNGSDYASVYSQYRDSRIQYYNALAKWNPEKKGDLAGWLNRANSFPAKYA